MAAASTRRGGISRRPRQARLPGNEARSKRLRRLLQYCRFHERESRAWYLSIIAVDPALQDRGLGRKLLEPTLAETDRVSATCYLETFSPRNVFLYERIGFTTRARFFEPTTRADYAVMVRSGQKV
jgi:ribosomal protein S18 acetylase RimI-like enzyme